MIGITDEQLAMRLFNGYDNKVLAKSLKTSVDYVRQIRAGHERPGVRAILDEMAGAAIDEAKRLARHQASELMACHARIGLNDAGETGRKCREYVLNHVLGDPSKAETNITTVHEAPGDTGAFEQLLAAAAERPGQGCRGRQAQDATA